MRTISNILILAICVLLLFSNVSAAQNVLDGVYVSNVDSIEQDGKYKPSISGTVTDEVTKEAIQGALIELTLEKGQIIKVYSGVKGYFSISNIETNSLLNIRCTKERYKTQIIGSNYRKESPQTPVNIQLEKEKKN